MAVRPRCGTGTRNSRLQESEKPAAAGDPAPLRLLDRVTWAANIIGTSLILAVMLLIMLVGIIL